MIDIQLFTNNPSRARVFSSILERILTVPKKYFGKSLEIEKSILSLSKSNGKQQPKQTDLKQYQKSE